MLRTIPLRYYLAVTLILGAANVFVYHTLIVTPAARVSVMSAGKGVVALVQIPGGMLVLIDTGSDASILRALGQTLPEWQRSLDAIILTSDSPKMTGGLSSILERYHVTHLIPLGGYDTPYGTSLIFNTSIIVTVIAPGIAYISYGNGSFPVSSTTPAGTYRL